MTMATRLESHLGARAIEYSLVSHPRSESSMETAAAAHVPGSRLAKAVITKDGDDYLMVVVPSDHHVHLGALHPELGRDVGLATESELTSLFPHCEVGAVPPVGVAYGLRALVERGLLVQPEIFFEAGDYVHLVKVSGPAFKDLNADAETVEVAQHL